MTTLTQISPADKIEQAWQHIKDARAEWNRAAEDDEAAEERHWQLVDAAENLIRETEGNTARSAEIKVWLAFLHTLTSRRDDDNTMREDLAAISAGEVELDWTARLMLSAIRDLRAMGA